MANKKIKINMIKEGKELSDVIIESKLVDKTLADGYSYVLDNSKYRLDTKLIDKFTANDLGVVMANKAKIAIFREVEILSKKRIYVLSMGDTRSFFQPDSFEFNFGIKTGISNLILKKEIIKLREITTKNKIDGDNLKHSKNSFSKLNNFSFKSITDILKEVKLKNEFQGVKSSWILNDALNFAISDELDPEELLKNIDSFLIENYNDSYTKEFPFLDDIMNVDGETTKKLNAEISNLLNKKIILSLAWPKFEDDRHDHFRIENQDKKYFIIDGEILLDIYENNSRKKIENIKIHSLDVNGEVVESKFLFNLIFQELNFEGKIYSLNDGKWFGINNSLSEIVDKEFDGIVANEWDTEVSNWPANIGSEGDYNEYLAQENNWMILDKKLIKFESRDKLELADLGFTENKADTLIAVKHLHNSKSISHLTNQVNNAIYAIKWQNIAVENFLKEYRDPKIEYDNTSMKTFVLLIAVEKFTDGKPDVPFFAKIVLVNLGNNRIHGVEIKYKFVERLIT